jgi:hypothetical protein
MSMQRKRTAPRCQSKAVDAFHEQVSTDVDNDLALLRRCVHDLGYTLDSLGVEMRLDKSLVSRVLNGERQCTLSFIKALPDDIEALYKSRQTEGFGRIVVEPLTGPDAARAFVSGFFGLIGGSPRLPARADRMAKAPLPSVDESEAAS